MYQYRTGNGQVWVGGTPPPKPAHNVVWLKPTTKREENQLWELRAYNKFSNTWDIISGTGEFGEWMQSSTVRGVEVVYGTAPMVQDDVIYIELEDTPTPPTPSTKRIYASN